MESEFDLPLGEEQPATALSLAEQGNTLYEIAVEMGCTEAQAALQAGPITPAQINRVEQMLLSRAIGYGHLAPHVQAAQFMLNAHRPELYGRAGQQQGSTTINVIVDRSGELRAKARVLEGTVVPVLATD